MAINAYIGRPGSGKSYSVVENVVLPALRSGRRLVTNLALNEQSIAEHFPSADILFFSSPQEFSSAADLANNLENRGAVFVVDECWKYYPAGARTNDLPKPLQTFLAEHRHFVGSDGFSTQVVLVTQSLWQIAPFARELIDTTFISSKLDKVGKPSSFRVDVYSGPANLNRPDPDTKVNTLMGTYSSDVWSFYKSHTQNDSGFMSGNESKVDKRGSVWSSPLVRYVLPLALLAVFGGLYTLKSLYDPARFREQKPVKTAPQAPREPVLYQASQGTPPLPEGPSRPPESTRYRLVGVIHGDRIRDGLAVVRDLHTLVDRTVSMSGACRSVPKLEGQWECLYFGEIVTFFSGESQKTSAL